MVKQLTESLRHAADTLWKNEWINRDFKLENVVVEDEINTGAVKYKVVDYGGVIKKEKAQSFENKECKRDYCIVGSHVCFLF